MDRWLFISDRNHSSDFYLTQACQADVQSSQTRLYHSISKDGEGKRFRVLIQKQRNLALYLGICCSLSGFLAFFFFLTPKEMHPIPLVQPSQAAKSWRRRKVV